MINNQSDRYQLYQNTLDDKTKIENTNDTQYDKIDRLQLYKSFYDHELEEEKRIKKDIFPILTMLAAVFAVIYFMYEGFIKEIIDKEKYIKYFYSCNTCATITWYIIIIPIIILSILKTKKNNIKKTIDTYITILIISEIIIFFVLFSMKQEINDELSIKHFRIIISIFILLTLFLLILHSLCCSWKICKFLFTHNEGYKIVNILTLERKRSNIEVRKIIERENNKNSNFFEHRHTDIEKIFYDISISEIITITAHNNKENIKQRELRDKIYSVMKTVMLLFTTSVIFIIIKMFIRTL